MAKVINEITDRNMQEARAHIAAKTFTPDQYQRIATKSAIYPGQGTHLGVMYVALKMNGEAGELAEHVGKAFRDDGIIVAELGPSVDGFKAGKMAMSPMSDERQLLIIKEIGDLLWYLSAMCNEMGITLTDAMLTNLEKLHSRTKRNALRGSGDDR